MVAAAQPPASPATDTTFQVKYAANLNIGESWLNISNTGANGAAVLGPGFGTPAGVMCANVYAFSPDEQLIYCCSCVVTPNALVNMGVARDLTSHTLTQVVPNSVVVKIVGTLADKGGTVASGTACNNSAALAGGAQFPLASGIVAWGTTVHNGPAGVPQYGVTETAFTPASLSAGELASITGRCASNIGNGTNHGYCPIAANGSGGNICQPGGLGATKL
jgi:hypothetical protein